MFENHYCSAQCHKTTSHAVLDSGRLECTVCGAMKDKTRHELWMGPCHPPIVLYKAPEPVQFSRHPRSHPLNLGHPQRGAVVPGGHEGGWLGLRRQHP